MSDRTILDYLLAVNAALDGLSTREKLDVVQIAWLTMGSNARTEALSIPGGFPEERARQVEQLEKMAELVSTAEPDLETERLFEEGDREGWLRRVRDQLDEGRGQNGGA